MGVYSNRVFPVSLNSIKIVAFGCIFILLNLSKTFGQLKVIQPHYTPPVSKTEEYFRIFRSNKYPDLGRPFLWIMNGEAQSIENAQIIFCKMKGVPDTLNEHRYDGVYFIRDISPGIYKLEVSAPGYETQIQHIQVYNQGIFQKRIALGKPGTSYLPSGLGFFPLTSPTENVSFELKKLYKNNEELEVLMPEFWEEIGKLRHKFNPSDSGNQYSNCLTWPIDSVKRIEFRRAIEENTILKTNLLNIQGGCPSQSGTLEKFTDFLIEGHADEKTIRLLFQKYNFNIYQMARNNMMGENILFWSIKTNYKAPLSLDFLRDIQKINLQLPIVRIEIEYIVAPETTDR